MTRQQQTDDEEPQGFSFGPCKTCVYFSSCPMKSQVDQSKGCSNYSPNLEHRSPSKDSVQLELPGLRNYIH